MWEKENSENCWAGIISIGYLGLLIKKLWKASITLPAAGRLQCRYVVPVAWDPEGKNIYTMFAPPNSRVNKILIS